MQGGLGRQRGPLKKVCFLHLSESLMHGLSFFPCTVDGKQTFFYIWYTRI